MEASERRSKAPRRCGLEVSSKPKAQNFLYCRDSKYEALWLRRIRDGDPGAKGSMTLSYVGVVFLRLSAQSPRSLFVTWTLCAYHTLAGRWGGASEEALREDPVLIRTSSKETPREDPGLSRTASVKAPRENPSIYN